MITQHEIHKQIVAILAVPGPDTAADDELGDFHLRQDERGRVIGDFFKCRLASVFQPVFGTIGGRVIAHEARVRCDGWSDEAVSPWGIFSMMAGDAALVRLDRLCRTLHILNYFGQVEPGLRLFLRVEPRLLTSVKEDHGRVFGEVLGRCGIAPSSIVIDIPVEAVGDRQLLIAAAANYRARGYQLSVNYPPRGDGGLLDEVTPEFVKIDFKCLHADQSSERIVSRIRGWGGSLIACKIENPHDLAIATGAGADLLQGFFLGAPHFEAREWHTVDAAPRTYASAASGENYEARGLP